MFKPTTTCRKPILTSAAMRACDDHTIQSLGIPSRTLMERAAHAVVAYLYRRADLFPCGRVLILCGNGNNGGDGMAAARFIADGSHGEARAVSVLYTGAWDNVKMAPDHTAMSEECARQYELLVAAGIPVLSPDDIHAALRESAVVIDAMLGIGIRGPVRGSVPEVIEAVTRSGLPVLAVDIPTGVCADDGRILGHVLPARATVTMQALKAGLLLYPGADACGEISVADVGIDLSEVARPFACLADEDLIRDMMPPRARRSHKGSYGRVLAVCGSVGMSGAAVLCARGALRAGAGLVEVLTPEENRPVLQISLPEAIVNAYDSRPAAIGSADAAEIRRRSDLRRQITEALSRASAVIVGCGLGTSDTSRLVLRTVLECFPTDRRVPLVLDADAINLLAEDPTLFDTKALSAPDRCVILTPHPAEMARLYTGGTPDGEAIAAFLEDTAAIATKFASRRGVTVVLKDAHTVVAAADGTRYICPFGNAGMATGGSGDVLGGVIAALFADRTVKRSEFASVAAAGVALHALAGDRAADALGEYGMIPSDLIEQIPLVTKEFSNTKTVVEFE